MSPLREQLFAVAAEDVEGQQERQSVDGGEREQRERAGARVQGEEQQRRTRGSDEQRFGMERHGAVDYLSRTRVPLIFWLLSALRKLGTRRSISSKYDESAGVFCCAL